MAVGGPGWSAARRGRRVPWTGPTAWVQHPPPPRCTGGWAPASRGNEPRFWRVAFWTFGHVLPCAGQRATFVVIISIVVITTTIAIPITITMPIGRTITMMMLVLIHHRPETHRAAPATCTQQGSEAAQGPCARLSHGAFRQISQSTRSAHCWSDVRRAEERARAERRF